MPPAIRLDTTSFPVVVIPEAGLTVGLLPVTRAQFDFYLGDPTGFPAEAFAEWSAACPRASWRTIPVDHPERVFATGLHPAEAERFAGWLGQGFRLPTEVDWRTVDRAFAGIATGPLRKLADDPRVHPAARSVLAWTLSRGAADGRDVGLSRGGLLEWVRLTGTQYGLHGRPSPTLLRLVHNPEKDPAHRPVTAARHPAFGFRVVRPLPPAPSPP